MGSCFSNVQVHANSKSATETRLDKAILKKREQLKYANQPVKTPGGKEKPGQTLTLEAIIMKFRKVKHAIELIKTTFTSNAQEDGSLNIDGLVRAMNVLHGSMTIEDIKHLFEFVDLDESKSISLKEFLVAMTVGHCLDLVPAVVKNADGTQTTEIVTGHLNDEIAVMLDLIVSAWILFDPDGKGFLVRSSIDNILGVHDGNHAKSKGNGSGGGGGFLSQEKWNEMDWDSNGTIDFAEFVFSFASWVDLDEDLAEGEEEEVKTATKK